MSMTGLDEVVLRITEKSYDLGHADGIAAERARVVALIEAEIKRLRDKVENTPNELPSLSIPAQIGRLVDILGMVKL